MNNKVCYHCDYARMMWQTRGAMLTPDNCELHRDGMCPDLDEPTVDAVEVVRCQNCNWWHRHKKGDLSRGVCDKYAMSKSENGYCDEPLLEERL